MGQGASNSQGRGTPRVNISDFYDGSSVGWFAALRDAHAEAVRCGATLVISERVALASGGYSPAITLTQPVEFQGDGAIDVSAGGAVTVAGQVISGKGQIFYPGTGTVTFNGKVNEVPPEWWGAQGTGLVDDYTAVAAALASGADVRLGAATYLIGSALIIPAQCKVKGLGQRRTTVKRGFTGDFITSQVSYSQLEDFSIDGDTATRGAGRGILIPADSFGQIHRNIEVINFSAACLEFGDDGGSEFKSFGCTYYTTGAQGVVAAVKGNGTTAAVPRHFFGTASLGCTLFDFGACDHWWAYGFYTNGLIFSSALAFNVELRGMRCGSLGGTIICQGDSHFISGVSAVSWDVRCTSSILDIQAPGWDVFESGAVAANNAIQVINPTGANVVWTPTITASGGGFAMGASTLTGRYSRRGAWLRCEFELTLGAGFAVGLGSWELSLPRAAIAAVPNQVCGNAYMTNNAATQASHGAMQIASGASVARVKCVALPPGTGGVDAGQFGPITWAAGSVIRGSFEYRVK